MAEIVVESTEKQTQINLQRAIVARCTGLPEGVIINIINKLEKEGIPLDQLNKSIEQKAATVKSPVAKMQV